MQTAVLGAYLVSMGCYLCHFNMHILFLPLFAMLGPNPNIAVIIDTFLIVSNVAVTFLCIYYVRLSYY